MLRPEVLRAFADEVLKLGSGVAAAREREARHRYYLAHKGQLQAKGKAYRLAHQFQLSKRKKLYRRKVKSGAKRVRKRISTGTGYTYADYR